MPPREPPSKHLYRAYIASIIIIATTALYCLIMLVIIYSKIEADDHYSAEGLQLRSIEFLLFNFPGITMLILANYYLDRVTGNRERRSRIFEVIGIVACLYTLILSAIAFPLL